MKGVAAVHFRTEVDKLQIQLRQESWAKRCVCSFAAVGVQALMECCMDWVFCSQCGHSGSWIWVALLAHHLIDRRLRMPVMFVGIEKEKKVSNGLDAHTHTRCIAVIRTRLNFLKNLPKPPPPFAPF